MAAALAPVAAKHGLTAFAIKNHRMHGHGLNFMLQAVVPEFDQARSQWLLHAADHGLDPSWLDAVVWSTDPQRPLGREFTVLGLRVGHGPARVKLRQAGTGREVFLRVSDFSAKMALRHSVAA